MSKRDSKKDFVVGLDIGTTKVCCIVAEVADTGHGSELEIIGFGNVVSTGLRKGVVVNIENTVECIKKAVEQAENMAGVEISTVFTGIAGGHIKSFNSTGVVAVKDREISKNDVSRVIDAARAVAIPNDREVLHVIPQEYRLDDQEGIKDPIGMSGVRLESRVHIVTGAVSSAQNIVKCANKAGLNVAEICLQPLASSVATLTEDEKELGVILVDIGGGTSDIAIFKEGAIAHTCVVPIGGNHITNDIAVGLRTPTHEAEKLKTMHGAAMASLVNPEETIEVAGVGGRNSRTVARRHLAEIIEPRVDEIFKVIKRELNASGFSDRLGGGLVITGGTSLLEGLPELAEFLFDMPVKRGVPHGVAGLKEVVSPKYATAVGLLKYAAKNKTKYKFSSRDRNIYEKVKGSMVGWIKDLF